MRSVQFTDVLHDTTTTPTTLQPEQVPGDDYVTIDTTPENGPLQVAAGDAPDTTKEGKDTQAGKGVNPST